MKKIIVANWKMNPGTVKEAQQLFAFYRGIKSKAEVVVCPAFPFLFLGRGLALGAQDCFWSQQGAFTSQVSPLMLKDLGVKYVILGHSEKRALGETNEVINKKVHAVLNSGMSLILCVGENKEQRERGDFLKVLERQVKEGLQKVAKAKISKVLIAYEPVWAIGSKNPCSVDNGLTAELFLRKLISIGWGKSAAKALRVLYGGSVDASNAGAYLASEWINGLLVGSASLNKKEFAQIVKSACKQKR